MQDFGMQIAACDELSRVDFGFKMRDMFDISIRNPQSKISN
jgi:hypothetical protein